MKEKIKLLIPVSDLKKCKEWDGIKIPAGSIYRLTIDYPLDEKRIFLIEGGEEGLYILQLLDLIGRHYREVFKERNNIYGHSIRDLVLEGLVIDHDKKMVRLEVGS